MSCMLPAPQPPLLTQADETVSEITESSIDSVSEEVIERKTSELDDISVMPPTQPILQEQSFVDDDESSKIEPDQTINYKIEEIPKDMTICPDANEEQEEEGTLDNIEEGFVIKERPANYGLNLCSPPKSVDEKKLVSSLKKVADSPKTL